MRYRLRIAYAPCVYVLGSHSNNRAYHTSARSTTVVYTIASHSEDLASEQTLTVGGPE